jgi:hypothetical protein
MTCDVCGEKIPFGICCDIIVNDDDGDTIDRGRE